MKSSEVKIFSVILVVAIVLVVVGFSPMFVAKEAPPPPPPGSEITRDLLVPPGSHMRGDPNAPTTVVVFSDFQCPSCKTGVPVMKEIMEKNPGKVNEVFHHYQATPGHIYALILARASEAAGVQGKFWEMHDALYDKQKELTTGTEDEVKIKLHGLAKTVGLDVMKFDVTMGKGDDGRFQSGNRLGLRAKIPGTPAYFVIDPKGDIKQYMSPLEIQKWGKTLQNSK